MLGSITFANRNCSDGKSCMHSDKLLATRKKTKRLAAIALLLIAITLFAIAESYSIIIWTIPIFTAFGLGYVGRLAQIVGGASIVTILVVRFLLPSAFPLLLLSNFILLPMGTYYFFVLIGIWIKGIAQQRGSKKYYHSITHLKRVVVIGLAILIIIFNVPSLAILALVFYEGGYAIYFLPFALGTLLFLVPAILALKNRSSSTLAVMILIAGLICSSYTALIFSSIFTPVRKLVAYVLTAMEPPSEAPPLRQRSETTFFDNNFPSSPLEKKLESISTDSLFKIIDIRPDTVLAIHYCEERIRNTEGSCSTGIVLEVEWVTRQNQFLSQMWITLNDDGWKSSNISSNYINRCCDEAITLGFASDYFKGQSSVACDFILVKHFRGRHDPTTYSLYVIDERQNAEHAFLFESAIAVTKEGGALIDYEACRLEFLPTEHSGLPDLRVLRTNLGGRVVSVDTFFFVNKYSEYLLKVIALSEMK